MSHPDALSWLQHHIFGKMVSLIVVRHQFYQNLACGAHFQFTNMNYLKKLIGIKSLNTKQCPARLYPPPVN